MNSEDKKGQENVLQHSLVFCPKSYIPDFKCPVSETMPNFLIIRVFGEDI